MKHSILAAMLDFITSYIYIYIVKLLELNLVYIYVENISIEVYFVSLCHSPQILSHDFTFKQNLCFRVAHHEIAMLTYFAMALNF